MAMRSLQPQIKAIQQRYAGDQVKFALPCPLKMSSLKHDSSVWFVVYT